MFKFNRIILICSMITFIATACLSQENLTAKPENNTIILQATTTPTFQTPTKTNFRIPSGNLPDTIRQIYESSQKITDGQLDISISVSDNRCYRSGKRTDLPDGKFVFYFGEPIPVIVSYKNLSGKSLKIIDYGNLDFARGRGLMPILSTLDGQRIATDHDSIPESSRPPDIDNYVLQDLPSDSVYNVSISYLPPMSVLYIDEFGKTQSMFLPPNRYMLKFAYYVTENQGIWSGIVSSNQIEFCIE